MPDEELELAPVIDPAAHAALALDNALLRAGVDLDSPQGQLVADAWRGREPQVEQIKASWELVKPALAVPEPAEPEPERIQGEMNQAAERRELNANSVVEPNPEDQDPRQVAIKAGLDVLAPPMGSSIGAGTNDDAMAAAFHVIAEAAGRGDSRVLVGYEPVT
jgi:hypothetical protein